jgi:hypothetical protein
LPRLRKARGTRGVPGGTVLLTGGVVVLFTTVIRVSGDGGPSLALLDGFKLLGGMGVRSE